MQCQQFFTRDALPTITARLENARSRLLLVFGSQSLFDRHRPALALAIPGAVIAGCTTAGEITGMQVTDDALSITLLEFEQTQLKLVSFDVIGPLQSASAGSHLAAKLTDADLCHVVVFSDGLSINGTPLVQALDHGLPDGIAVTGGLAGDGARFQSTAVFDNTGSHGKRVLGLGFYSKQLKVAFGSLGGWDSFGPDRVVTKAEGNVLYQLDGESALQLYKTYLGPQASGLPASGLHFPLNIHDGDDKKGIVRTLLAVDEANDSMTFAGDIPVGSYARLMRANFERLIEGAVNAAHDASVRDARADFALLVSCVGRKLVLGQRIEEEIEGVRNVLGSRTTLAGFYSYGELCPQQTDDGCALHNQTMTITCFAEHSVEKA